MKQNIKKKTNKVYKRKINKSKHTKHIKKYVGGAHGASFSKSFNTKTNTKKDKREENIMISLSTYKKLDNGYEFSKFGDLVPAHNYQKESYLDFIKTKTFLQSNITDKQYQVRNNDNKLVRFNLKRINILTGKLDSKCPVYLVRPELDTKNPISLLIDIHNQEEFANIKPEILDDYFNYDYIGKLWKNMQLDLTLQKPFIKSLIRSLPYTNWIIYAKLMAGTYPPPDTFKILEDIGFTHIYSLMEEFEINPTYYDKVKSHEDTNINTNIVMVRKPIIDMNVTLTPYEAFLIAKEIYDKINQGGLIYLHCMGGKGRTGTIAGMILLLYGKKYVDVIDWLKNSMNSRHIQGNYAQMLQTPIQFNQITHISNNLINLLNTYKSSYKSFEMSYDIEKSLHLALALKSIYTPRYEFSNWVTDNEQNLYNDFNFKDTVVYYNDKDNDKDNTHIDDVVKITIQREPCNISMKSIYDINKLKACFGWEKGAYTLTSRNGGLMPNIAIYCKALLRNKHTKEYINVDVINLIGYAFDNETQPDYKYFKKLNKFDDEFKMELKKKYNNMWKLALAAAIESKKQRFRIFNIGGGAFSEKVKDFITTKEDKQNFNFFKDIFLPSFTPLLELFRDNNIEIVGYNDEGFDNSIFIPNIIIDSDDGDDYKNTLYANAWDPWSIIGNGNHLDRTLDGYWGRSTNLSVIGWFITNPHMTFKTVAINTDEHKIKIDPISEDIIKESLKNFTSSLYK